MSSAGQIRDIATRLFAQQGFDGTSIQAIAREVGITKQSLLYHYENKEVLRHAVLDNLFAHWRDALPQLLAAVTSGEDRFDLLTRELIDFFRADPDRARLIIRELLDRPAEMQRIVEENLRPWIHVVAQYIRAGQATSELHADIDADSYVLHVIHLVIATIAGFPLLSAALPRNGATTGSEEQRHLDELLRLVRTALFRPTDGQASRPFAEKREIERTEPPA